MFTRNKAFEERIRRMRSHGMKSISWDKYRGRLSSYDIEEVGYNYRTSEIPSALGLVQLRKLEGNNRRRGKRVEAYRRALQGTEGISIPFSKGWVRPSYHLFPILVSPSADRTRVMEKLGLHRIQTSIHFPPVHLFSLYRKEFGYREGMLPLTEEVSRREITLPLHPGMRIDDVKWIAEKVKAVIRELP